MVFMLMWLLNSFPDANGNKAIATSSAMARCQCGGKKKNEGISGVDNFPHVFLVILFSSDSYMMNQDNNVIMVIDLNYLCSSRITMTTLSC